MLRIALLSILAFDMGLILIRVASYPGVLVMPGGVLVVVEPTIAFLSLGLFVLWLTSGRRHHSLAEATAWGLGGGFILAAHMALENFGSRIGENGELTLAAMISAFAIWCLAAYRSTRADKSLGAGIATGCWAAVVTVLCAVSFGFVLMFFDIPRPDYVATWPEYVRSGWGDPHAFAIANSLESGFTQLLTAVILGGFLGALGGGMALMQRKIASPR